MKIISFVMSVVLSLPCSSMQIFVRDFSGRTHTINDVEPDDTIAHLKEILQAKIVFEEPRDIITYQGKELLNHKTLKEYEIEKSSTVQIRMRLGVQINLREGI